MERNHNTPVPPANDLRQLFRVHSILTLDELKSALGTQVAMTVFRKLRPLAYLSSYSHRGKYYTLNEIARFDQFGLWSHHQVRFSRHRTLINTCAVLVADSEAGYSADELEHLLHVQVKDPLRKLALQGRIRRSKVGLRWVHFSPTASTTMPSCAPDTSPSPRRPLRPSALSGGSCPTSCAPPSSCSIPCSTNANAVSTPHLNRSKSATAVTAASPSCSVSTPAPWPGGASNCWPATASASGSAAPVAGGHRWKKNLQRERRHPGGAHARCRRRSHYRCPLDAPHH